MNVSARSSSSPSYAMNIASIVKLTILPSEVPNIGLTEICVDIVPSGFVTGCELNIVSAVSGGAKPIPATLLACCCEVGWGLSGSNALITFGSLNESSYGFMKGLLSKAGSLFSLTLPPGEVTKLKT